MTGLYNLAKLGIALGVQLLNIVEDNKRILHIAAEVLYSVGVSVATERSAVCLDVALVA